ncbi:MAG: N-acetyl-gamma-glutamyl-phosphate reductase, partial [Oscillospiraceae bacterium]|nr:N-acetyl-gamma-glutamyl-phosphate reductase [Oscillospiraceae bacterium]
QIHARLGARDDIRLLTIDEARRKDAPERKRLINSADIVFLCLPDDAAREAVALVENENTRVIDASTAHRISPGWDYGFPELSGAHRAAIAKSTRVANPGCHATGFLAIVYPLIALGILPVDYPLTCFSLTGYSGGGKKMIAEYEAAKTPDMSAPGIYALAQDHKHLPEMTHIAGLPAPPIFCPVVDDYYAGIAVTVPLHARLLTFQPPAFQPPASLSAPPPPSESGALRGDGRGLRWPRWKAGFQQKDGIILKSDNIQKHLASPKAPLSEGGGGAVGDAGGWTRGGGAESDAGGWTRGGRATGGAGAWNANSLRAALAEYYAGARFISVAGEHSSPLHSNYGVGTNNLEITVSGAEDRITVTSRFDNLGKGASGAAVQNMNIMLGLDEGTGL